MGNTHAGSNPASRICSFFRVIRKIASTVGQAPVRVAEIQQLAEGLTNLSSGPTFDAGTEDVAAGRTEQPMQRSSNVGSVPGII